MAKVYTKGSARRSKYGVRTDAKGKLDRTCDGIVFASQREMKRYCELKLMEKVGAVSGIELQPAYPLYVWDTVNKVATPIGKYVADFRYVLHSPSGLVIDVVEDVKGVKTPVYRLKKKMVEAQYGIEIREV